ncbi:thermonuclease family protein [Magnetospirillum sp. UT-4]|uniref:thermonuclease family protein n=1 Tax=Magnetospirillum sp. UT-4 TaxID=2681467 RepID=UPI001384829A|nr:thermonuclease family protein [Magnetospirillum sp. UT-4]CAA7625295.1 putative Staphylococcal nuclease-like protein [Magnetospirillum sp. UT-4]
MKFHGFFAALMAAITPASAAETLSGPYAAQVVRVLDGDTFEARVRIWLGLDQTIRVRLLGIDAPELRGPCPQAAAAARDALARLLGDGPALLTRIAHDKYGGRIDAAVSLPNGEDVATVMLGAGLVRPQPDPAQGPVCPPFRK